MQKNALICKICYICYERLLHLLLSRTEPKSELLPLVSSWSFLRRLPARQPHASYWEGVRGWLAGRVRAARATSWVGDTCTCNLTFLPRLCRRLTPCQMERPHAKWHKLWERPHAKRHKLWRTLQPRHHPLIGIKAAGRGDGWIPSGHECSEVLDVSCRGYLFYVAKGQRANLLTVFCCIFLIL